MQNENTLILFLGFRIYVSYTLAGTHHENALQEFVNSQILGYV